MVPPNFLQGRFMIKESQSSSVTTNSNESYHPSKWFFHQLWNYEFNSSPELRSMWLQTHSWALYAVLALCVSLANYQPVNIILHGTDKLLPYWDSVKAIADYDKNSLGGLTVCANNNLQWTQSIYIPVRGPSHQNLACSSDWSPLPGQHETGRPVKQ